MFELVNKRLVHLPARVFLRGHATTHFGGPNGTITFEPAQMAHLNSTRQCHPATVGEFWCAARRLHAL